MEKKSNKKKILIPLAIVIGIILAAAGGVLGYLYSHYSSKVFLKNTTINGYDVSGQTIAEASQTIRQQYDEEVVILYEQDIRQMSGYLKDYGYLLNEDGVESLVKKAMSIQKENLTTVLQALMGRSRYQMALPVTFDEAKFQKTVTAARLKTPRVASTDAELIYDEASQQYTITPETYGNEIQDSELQELVKTAIDAYTASPEEKKASELTISLTEDLYQEPAVLSTDAVLNNQQASWNQYCKAKIVYTFGSETEVLDWSTIKDWIQLQEDGTGVLMEEPIRNWLRDFANRHDTRYFSRTFHTSVGTTVTFSGNQNEYGYTTNESAEYEKLLGDLAQNTEITREPVYYKTNDFGNPVYYSRNGQDDLNGTYVEVNLSLQHLWFYKNGKKIVESDFVSGSVAKKAETQTGVFPLAYKESPSVLVGTNANDGYETEVQYWMPFYEGQGLHDATWRSSFGGNIYQTNGSHGCVNLPYAAAETIYNNIESGTAIIVYK